MRITIKDVAREAGVSIGTVDRVLNNRQGVSDKTKKKVNDVVERLGYKPSMVAQALVSKGKKIKIGVIYPNVEVQFWDEVVKGIEYSQKRLEPFGVELKVVASKTYSYKEQLELLQYFKKEGVDGIVTMAYHPYRINDMINELYDNGIPVATFISDAPDSKRICFTGLDNFKSGEVAASLMDLYLRGKGKVAIIGIHRDVKCIDDRVRGFVDRIRITDDSIRVVSILNARDHCRDVDMEFRKTVRRMTKIVVNENRD